jgi:pectin lyase
MFSKPLPLRDSLWPGRLAMTAALNAALALSVPAWAQTAAEPAVASVGVDSLALGSGVVELFINGVLVQTPTPDAGTDWIELVRANLVEGDNMIAVRAQRGLDNVPYAVTRLYGDFGFINSSEFWSAKAATTSSETTGAGAWTSLAYDDSKWAKATLVGDSAWGTGPRAGVQAIWTANRADATALLRLKFYLPPGLNAAKPVGFGQAATGGQGGEEVTVSTPDELASALCRTKDSKGFCTDSTPRIITVDSTIDFTGREGLDSVLACKQSVCAAPMQDEYRINSDNSCAVGSTFLNSIDAAGRRPLAVGSNKTLIGVENNAIIKGKGLTLMGKVSNIIIRNISITDINPQFIWGGDAVTINDASNVWIDHNYFARIGRQMIVTGADGPAQNVTISWNEFDGKNVYSAYCDGNHYWNLLMLGLNDTITFSNNFMHNTSGRAPHAGGLFNSTVAMQIANNYFENLSQEGASNPRTPLVKLLIEGNYYKKVPITVYVKQSQPGYAWAPATSISAENNALCVSSLGRPCVLNVAAPMPTSQFSSWPMDTPVMSRFSTAPAGTVVAPYDAVNVPNAVPHLSGVGHL